ncbi:MAG: ABC transporter permease, partial [Ferruginibacter sp.]|nr:ABC transporter permease [Ferruginibacter sp.]
MWSLLQIELYKISKRPRTYIAFLAIAGIVLIIQAAFKADPGYLNILLQNVGDTFEVDKGKVINGYFMCYMILNTLLIQVPILIALVAGDAISGEANMGTLRLLLTKPISRTKIIGVKFLASIIYTVALLIFMALLALFLSMAIFGVDDLLVFRAKGDESQILQITKDDIMWRYLAAFAYAAVALTVIAALALFLSVFAENSIGPIVATVCIVIVCTIISNLNIPIIDKNIRPWLFTSYLVGW